MQEAPVRSCHTIGPKVDPSSTAKQKHKEMMFSHEFTATKVAHIIPKTVDYPIRQACKRAEPKSGTACLWSSAKPSRESHAVERKNPFLLSAKRNPSVFRFLGVLQSMGSIRMSCASYANTHALTTIRYGIALHVCSWREGESIISLLFQVNAGCT